MMSLTSIVTVVGLALLPVGAIVAYELMKNASTNTDSLRPKDGYKEIDWRVLRQLDVSTGSKPSELAALDGASVKVPGFIVPLDDDSIGVSEFLLVPSPQSCIHVPPPPPNQMIMIRMASGKALQRSGGAVWVMGRLSIDTKDSKYGKISYSMRGEESIPYAIEDAQN